MKPSKHRLRCVQDQYWLLVFPACVRPRVHIVWITWSVNKRPVWLTAERRRFLKVLADGEKFSANNGLLMSSYPQGMFFPRHNDKGPSEDTLSVILNAIRGFERWKLQTSLPSSRCCRWPAGLLHGVADTKGQFGSYFHLKLSDVPECWLLKTKTTYSS